MVLRLGTRRSLLARAQSQQVAREIERLNPGTRVELVGIDTQGDRIQDIPLQKVEGKDFFVAELDRALIAGEVDLTVHSFKDLSLERDPALVCAAIPRRADPRDALLLAPSAEERLRAGLPVRIGTSSPRRLENLPPFLTRTLPHFDGRAPQVAMTEIRGNVNTRISRVLEPANSPKKLDAVVLALAGLARLAMDGEGRAELGKLLPSLRWMILPLRECPTAAAQGALAIECRRADQATFAQIHRLHDVATEKRVARERALLSEFGGGCHQRFGSTCIEHAELGELFFVRGAKPSGATVDELHWPKPRAAGAGDFWDGSRHSASAEAITGGAPAAAVFVANAKAVHGNWESALTRSRVWVSGTASWEKLARLGLWVEGSAEGLGFDFIRGLVELPVLELPRLSDWIALTHEGAREGWSDVRAVGTYRLRSPADDVEARRLISQAAHLFWASGSQFERLGSAARPTATHACGAGKTARALRERGLQPLVFPSVEEWRKWAKP